MEKTVNVGGKEMRLKAVAKLPIVFEAQFGKNFMEVQDKLFKIGYIDTDGNVKLDLSKLDYVGLCQILWSMAKLADSNTPPYEQWLDSLEELPAVDVIEETIDLLTANLVSKSKIKNASAAVN